jgi:hypothetical protein
MASLSWRATFGSPRTLSPRGAGREICSICLVIESSR